MRPPTIVISLLLALVSPVRLICPYHHRWLRAEGVEDGNQQFPQRQRFLQEGPVAGAGFCAFTNPVTQQRMCVQLTGSAWVEELEKAKRKCTVEGLLPGVEDGEYEFGKLCAEYEKETFAGVCIDGMGGSEETRLVMATEEGNPLGTCTALETSCNTFVRGVFEAKRGTCEENEQEGSRSNVTELSSPCQLNPGISGGGHMHGDSQWDKGCENQGNQYAIPMRWAAATESIELQGGGKAVGYVYYDAENNRKRHDVVQVEGEIRIAFLGIRNVTLIHDRFTMYIIDRETLACTTMGSPVGNLRPTWAIDNHGDGSVSQYLGTSYLMYDGRFRRVRQWRKTEPLEDAYLVITYDEENEWETPEGIKRRVLRRMSPGDPGVGDTIDMYYNHTTEFDDSVFDILKEVECQPIDPVTAGTIPALNPNSTIRIDSGITPVECDECGIVYTHEEEEEKATKPSTPAEYFSGEKILTSEPYMVLIWEYFPNNDTFSFTMKRQGSVGWLGISFPKFGCAMVPSEGVIAASSDDDGFQVDAYQLKIASTAGINVDSKQTLESAELLQTNGAMTLRFTRKADNGGEVVLKPTVPIEVIWATGQTASLGYHGSGSEERGCLTINKDGSQVTEGL